MSHRELPTSIVDLATRKRTVQRFREQGVTLPTFAMLADPSRIPADITEKLAGIDPDAAHPLNLYRVHWFNAADRKGKVSVPGHLVLPPELTGVKSPILVALGERFPMITAHKVLAAYGCLVPRLVSGAFDPTRHRAVWPSTGNYCRGGVAISRILGCRGVAVLPEDMSAERFSWLENWVTHQEDIIRTPGCESNVKEIYDKCHELSLDDDNFILNQFSEFANHLVHWRVTGPALGKVFESWAQGQKAAGNVDVQLVAFVSATGSAGTIAAGDYLKDHYGSKTVAVEAAECPTMLKNGFGGHNIQGIGDKHIPLIHNVMDSDFAVAVSDEATDSLTMLFNTPKGKAYLVERKGLNPQLVDSLASLGFSGICNVLAAIKVAKYLDLGPDQAIITVGTDGAAMYHSENEKILDTRFGGRFDEVSAGEAWGQFLAGAATDNLQELTKEDRDRIFNLGYFTWVEQQGETVEAFEARRKKAFWLKLRDAVPVWDQMIDQLNAEVRAGEA